MASRVPLTHFLGYEKWAVYCPGRAEQRKYPMQNKKIGVPFTHSSSKPINMLMGSVILPAPTRRMPILLTQKSPLIGDDRLASPAQTHANTAHAKKPVDR